MIGDPSNPPGNVVGMNGAPETSAPRTMPRPFDDPAQQRRRLALFNEIKDYARGQNYPGVPDGAISTMAAEASHKLDTMGGADRASFVAHGDASVTDLVQKTFANFINSTTEREREAMRQPPASAATAGADKDKPNRDGIDPLTGLMGVERQALGGMRTATTAGTNADSGNTGGSARGGSSGSAAYDTMGTHSYGSTAYWASPQGLTETRSFAVQNGVPWVASNPQLLRLGVPAVKILADAHLTKENYNVLHKGVGLSDKASVGIVRYWNDQGEDANKKAAELGRIHGAIKKTSPEAAEGFTKATQKFGEAALTGSPEQVEKAKSELDSSIDALAKKHPKAAAQLRQGRDVVAEKAKKASAATKEAGQATQTAQQDQQAAKQDKKASASSAGAKNEALADLASLAPPIKPATQTDAKPKLAKQATP